MTTQELRTKLREALSNAMLDAAVQTVHGTFSAHNKHVDALTAIAVQFAKEHGDKVVRAVENVDIGRIPASGDLHIGFRVGDALSAAGKVANNIV